MEAEDDDNEEDKKCSSLDFRRAFPFGRIRGQIRKEKEIGKLSKGAVELVGACSAVFLSRLMTHAAAVAVETEGDSMPPTKKRKKIVVTCEDLKETIRSKGQSMEFLMCTLDEMKEQNAPLIKKKTQVLSKEVLGAVITSKMDGHLRQDDTVIVDDEDYD